MNPNVRPAAVAGMFYPASAAILLRDVTQMLSEASQKTLLNPKAIIVPHAGYVYSGPVAATIYAQLSALRDRVRRIVLLGPTHRVAINGLALPTCTAFATPLGIVPVDQKAIAAIEDLPQIVFYDPTHAQEHSLEVQLPFLQTVFGDFSFLPLAVGQATPEEVAEVLERVWGGEETLIVVSSDLSHYQPYAVAKRIDAQTARLILDLDPTIDHQQACGATPVNGLLLAARQHGLRGRLLDLRNSGDTAGDKSRVVGYGAFAFLEGEHDAH
ncbi:AmmeMemoRadiSam system protein B [Propionivibrio sp.]|uniref:AmmeMemoRadiSam system protein B n=1 Tax=Propionivibrio sp. TaxID=2212460 RepID=UPI003BF39237